MTPTSKFFKWTSKDIKYYNEIKAKPFKKRLLIARICLLVTTNYYRLTLQELQKDNPYDLEELNDALQSLKRGFYKYRIKENATDLLDELNEYTQQ